MKETNWKVKINNFDYSLMSQVFIYRFCGGMVEYLEINTPDIKVIREKYDEGANKIKPTFVCPQDTAIDISKAFIEYANSQGFKNGDETFAKGKLEATENHLKDMRKLLKLTSNE